MNIYDQVQVITASVMMGYLNCNTITLQNNQSEKFIRSSAWGGAIRLMANSSAAGDRGLQLGRVDNNLALHLHLQ